MHVSIYACICVNYLYISKFMFQLYIEILIHSLFSRMAQFHLLDPTYEATHQGRLIVLGKVIIIKFCSKFGERTCIREVTGDYVLLDAGPSAPSS